MSDILKNKISNAIKKLPNSPGVYLFYSQNKELIYVGKATSLKDRVRSYFIGRGERPFAPTLLARPVEQMIHEVVDIKWEKTESVLEAIILEAIYIKKFLPKYNVLGKDDKSWNYLVVSKDVYPKIETIREKEFETIKQKNNKSKNQFKYVFGPYPGLNTKATLKLLRKMFRYSTCTPPVIPTEESRFASGRRVEESLNVGERDFSTPLRGVYPERSRGARNDRRSRPCLYYQMGLCLGVCTGEISPSDYNKKVIRPLVMFLRGQKRGVVKLFERQMKEASKNLNYEEAARLRDQLKNLRRIQDVALLNKTFVEDLKIENWKLKIRIEGYDISNLGAHEKVASMVVFDANGPIKKDYRKFIIKTVSGQSDVDCLKEVIRRRFNHHEWPMPNVIMVDGGRPQVNKVRHVIRVSPVEQVKKIPIVGIAKGPERKRNDFILGDKAPSFIIWVHNNKNLLIRVRDEAHRFAIAFHRYRRGKIQYTFNAKVVV